MLSAIVMKFSKCQKISQTVDSFIFLVCKNYCVKNSLIAQSLCNTGTTN